MPEDRRLRFGANADLIAFRIARSGSFHLSPWTAWGRTKVSHILAHLDITKGHLVDGFARDKTDLYGFKAERVIWRRTGGRQRKHPHPLQGRLEHDDDCRRCAAPPSPLRGRVGLRNGSEKRRPCRLSRQGKQEQGFHSISCLFVVEQRS